MTAIGRGPGFIAGWNSGITTASGEAVFGPVSCREWRVNEAGECCEEVERFESRTGCVTYETLVDLFRANRQPIGMCWPTLIMSVLQYDEILGPSFGGPR